MYYGVTGWWCGRRRRSGRRRKRKEEHVQYNKQNLTQGVRKKKTLIRNLQGFYSFVLIPFSLHFALWTLDFRIFDLNI